jgi:glycosyltransferase involved in cell wall biosynthesis
MEPRILVIIDAFTYGGAQRVLLTLIPVWKATGCEIEVVLIQNNAREMDLQPLVNLGVKIHRLSARNMFDIRALKSLLKLASVFRPSIIQSHLYWAQIWGVFPRLSISGTRLFWVEHNTYFERSPLHWRVFRLMARQTDRVISVSYEVQDYLRTKKVISTEVIVNPISEVFAYRSDIDRSNTFVFLGRLNNQKNPVLTIRAFDFAKKNNYISKEAKLVIGGEGPLVENLKVYVSELASRDSISFVGQLTEHQSANLLQSSISLISTSIFEGFSLVRVEALATGATVISTRTGGIMGILTDSPHSKQLVSGVFVTSPEVTEIAKQMSAVSDPVYWEEDSVKERLIAAARHNPDKVAHDYLVSFNRTDLKEDFGWLKARKTFLRNRHRSS